MAQGLKVIHQITPRFYCLQDSLQDAKASMMPLNNLVQKNPFEIDPYS